MLLALVHTGLWTPLGVRIVVQAVRRNRANRKTEPEQVVEVETKNRASASPRRQRPALAQGLPQSHVEKGARLQLFPVQHLPQRQHRFPDLWPVVVLLVLVLSALLLLLLLVVLLRRGYLYQHSRRSPGALPLLSQEDQAVTGPFPIIALSAPSIKER